jgi:hypothetical protein
LEYLEYVQAWLLDQEYFFSTSTYLAKNVTTGDEAL